MRTNHCVYVSLSWVLSLVVAVALGSPHVPSGGFVVAASVGGGPSPEERASALLKQMSLAEKVHLLHGSGSGYTGNVAGTPRLQIPALKMNDGPQGFRGDAGTSTSFPGGLTVAATWDIQLASLWGQAMGKEFYDKGANVQLGPGLCVARVPNNGRNFEYASGEDPFLGATLMPNIIRGIQSQHVVANAKHWVNNNQETDRGGVSENVDERTQFEMYYPPFEAAVKADVGSVMCSYNRIRQTYSCENNETLQRDLKERLGFRGWVMSDWGATHSLSLNAGLDQEMPGQSFLSDDAISQAVAAGEVSQAKVDDSVLRILTPLFQVGAFDYPSNGTADANVTSAAHNQIARNISAAAMVLLKNDGVLPLSTDVTNIALIGSEAAYPTTHGGGSGAVEPGFVATPAFGILNKLGLPFPIPLPSNCSDGQFDKGFDYQNQDDQTSAPASSVDECCALCAARSDVCNYFTYVDATCWMKSTNRNRVPNAAAISGACHATPPPPPRKDNCSDGHFFKGLDFRNSDDQTQAAASTIEECCSMCAARPDGQCSYFTLAYGQCFMKATNKNPVPDADATSGICHATLPPPRQRCLNGVCVTTTVDSPTAAAAAAAAADLSIVFIATTSSEGSDRTDLSFGIGDSLVEAAIQATKSNSTKKVIVVAVTPGAALLPWSDGASAVLVSFFPGQEYGNAISDVLFGVVNPSAKLPLTFPNVENEQNFSTIQWPGINGQANYTEGAYFGYRWYQKHGVKPAFPFGFGLSYTSFDYSELRYDPTTRTVTCVVTNSGHAVGQEVAQLYLGLPPGVRGLTSPAKQLKGFHKTSLLGPGETEKVAFPLEVRDLSIWDTETAAWAQVSGTIHVYVGCSSEDTPLTMSISAP